ncbi:MAG: methyltransferase domain-containing protein [Candidatus Hodarchaeota archaeon]
MYKYDPKLIESHYDEAGVKEWDRLDTTPHGKVQFHIHQHYLQKYIKKEDRVLEIGPGPGRFTIELGKIGASIGVVDISQGQLKLNEEKVKEAGFESKVEWRKKLDILNLEGIPDNSFDATVCYGGPLSYVMERVEEALKEVLRVTKPEGYILTSVMSCLGTYSHFIEAIFHEVNEGRYDLEGLDELTRTGDVAGKYADNSSHHCHMFRWSEFQEILSRYPVEILDVSAANFLSTGSTRNEKLIEVMNKPEQWEKLLKWELEFCAEPGAIDAATHFLVVFKKIS